MATKTQTEAEHVQTLQHLVAQLTAAQVFRSARNPDDVYAVCSTVYEASERIASGSEKHVALPRLVRAARCLPVAVLPLEGDFIEWLKALNAKYTN